jgi:hypothetical protein
MVHDNLPQLTRSARFRAYLKRGKTYENSTRASWGLTQHGRAGAADRTADWDLCDVRVRLDSCVPVFTALAPIGLAEVVGHLSPLSISRSCSRAWSRYAAATHSRTDRR